MSILRFIIGLVLIAGAVVIMAMNPENMVMWILGGAAIAGGGVLVISSFRKKQNL